MKPTRLFELSKRTSPRYLNPCGGRRETTSVIAGNLVFSSSIRDSCHSRKAIVASRSERHDRLANHQTIDDCKPYVTVIDGSQDSVQATPSQFDNDRLFPGELHHLSRGRVILELERRRFWNSRNGEFGTQRLSTSISRDANFDLEGCRLRSRKGSSSISTKAIFDPVVALRSCLRTLYGKIDTKGCGVITSI